MDAGPKKFLPPGGPSDFVFSFDTTGSMSRILDEVRDRLRGMIQRLQADIPGIRNAVIAHGDYCDREHFYVTKHVDFTTDIRRLCQFVTDVGGTGGGDVDECYELVLRQVRENLSWRSGTQRALVLIGDAPPHEPTYELNTLNIDWKEETSLLASMGVKIYAVQVFDDRSATPFYQHLANATDGRYLKLRDFSNIADFLMAICYTEKGQDFLQVYEKEVRARNTGAGLLHKDLEDLFGVLRNGDGPAGPSIPANRQAGRPAAVTRKKDSAGRTAPGTPRRVSDRLPDKRLEREDVSRARFDLRHLCWSPWRLVVVPGRPDAAGKWTRRRNGPGWRRGRLFRGHTDRVAVYEVGVQSRAGAKIYAVYFKTTRGFPSGVPWDRSLLRGWGIRRQINGVIANGCRVHIRRALLKGKGTLNDSESILGRRYDYAWKRYRGRRDTCRLVIKGAVKISKY